MIYYNNVILPLIYAENIVLQYQWKIKLHLIKHMKYIEEKNHKNYVRIFFIIKIMSVQKILKIILFNCVIKIKHKSISFFQIQNVFVI